MSLRERLAARQLPTMKLSIRVDFSPEADEATDRLSRAQRDLRLAEARAEDTTDAQKVVDDAQAAVDGGYEVLRLQALPPADFEALLSAHPPTEEQRKRGEGVNEAMLRAPLLAACVEGDETEADWADYLAKGAITSGEVRSLYFAAMSCNDRTGELRVPSKG